MIKIISGTCRTELGLKTSKDEPFSLSSEAEKRLVDRKVARYIWPNVNMAAVATPPVDSKNEETSVNSAETKNGSEGDGDGDAQNIVIDAANLNIEQLKTLKLDQLKKLAQDMGIEATGLRSRDDYANAIAAVCVTVPDLSAEDPVV